MEGAYLTAGGPIFLGVMIILTLTLKWPTWMHYVWGGAAILWGLLAFGGAI